jgi:hypothetical protein
MKTYKVTFTNCSPIIVRVSDRNDAIRVAVLKTRGYLSATQQRANVVSAKEDK